MKIRSIIAASAAFGLALAAAGAANAACVKKAGSGWGLTKGMAQFQSFEIIEQVTGNWPVRKDNISKPVYDCKEGSVGWSCKAYATVCKKS
jgi:hypothetical protein